MATSVIGKLSYFREDIIGRGAFSIVYSGLWEGDKPVAIKRILRSPDLKNGHNVRHELELMMKADHPNIVRLFGYEMNEDFRYNQLYSYFKFKLFIF